jgi:transcriptional regulator with XRE-family HTH domain
VSTETLTSFGEFAQMLDELPAALRTARRMRGLSLRAVSREVGLSFSTVTRIESGEEFSSVSLRAILTWLDKPAPALTDTQETDRA